MTLIHLDYSCIADNFIEGCSIYFLLSMLYTNFEDYAVDIVKNKSAKRMRRSDSYSDKTFLDGGALSSSHNNARHYH